MGASTIPGADITSTCLRGARFRRRKYYQLFTFRSVGVIYGKYLDLRIHKLLQAWYSVFCHVESLPTVWVILILIPNPHPIFIKSLLYLHIVWNS